MQATRHLLSQLKQETKGLGDGSSSSGFLAMSGSDSSDSGMTPRARATLATITQENRRHQIDWLVSAVRSVEARLSVEEDRGAERNWNKEFQDILGNVLGNSLATSVVVLTPFFYRFVLDLRDRKGSKCWACSPLKTVPFPHIPSALLPRLNA